MSSSLLALFLAAHLNGVDLSDVSQFCSVHTQAVACNGHHGRVLPLAEVKRVDAVLRRRFVYKDWASRTEKGHLGNCVDYSLMLSRRLAEAGEDGDALTLVFMIQCDVDCGVHARLWVRTADAGVVEADNMHSPAGAWHDGVYLGFMKEDGQQIVSPAQGYHRDLVGIERN